MPTYEQYRYQRELKEKRQMQDAVTAKRHREWNLSAQDKHAKYERAHFAVVGEGTLTAQDAYRRGWERTFGKESR